MQLTRAEYINTINEAGPRKLRKKKKKKEEKKNVLPSMFQNTSIFCLSTSEPQDCHKDKLQLELYKLRTMRTLLNKSYKTSNPRTHQMEKIKIHPFSFFLRRRHILLKSLLVTSRISRNLIKSSKYNKLVHG